jgi:ABC-type ATPase involved in cell division
MQWQDFRLYDISYFAKSNFRNTQQIFGIKQADRLYHFYCFGKSGSGKTSLLKTLMYQDAQADRGFAFLDVHGDASREIVTELKSRFPNRTFVYFNVTDANLDFGYNPLPTAL